MVSGVLKFSSGALVSLRQLSSRFWKINFVVIYLYFKPRHRRVSKINKLFLLLRSHTTRFSTSFPSESMCLQVESFFLQSFLLQHSSSSWLLSLCFPGNLSGALSHGISTKGHLPSFHICVLKGFWVYLNFIVRYMLRAKQNK